MATTMFFKTRQAFIKPLWALAALLRCRSSLDLGFVVVAMVRVGDKHQVASIARKNTSCHGFHARRR